MKSSQISVLVFFSAPCSWKVLFHFHTLCICLETLKYHNHSWLFYPYFLGSFTKLQKATISLVISVLPSVQMESLDSNWSDFHDIWHLSIFRKTVG